MKFSSRWVLRSVPSFLPITPNKGELRTDTVSDEDDTETFLKYETYLKMLGLDPSDLPNAGSVQAKVEEFEKEAKRKFVEEPANMKLLIVVDKLLTGFDAPPCTYLYIDKRMQDHGLFQAICRVNRLDDDTRTSAISWLQATVRALQTARGLYLRSF